MEHGAWRKETGKWRLHEGKRVRNDSGGVEC